MRRFTLRRLFAAYLGVWLHVFSASGQTLRSSQHPLYVNRVYKFQVTLPPGVTYERNRPPNPDHGFSIDLVGGTRLWVDASYVDTPATEDEVKRQTDGCHVEADKPATLGMLTARSLIFVCPANSYGGAYREQVVMAVTRLYGRSPICYLVAMRTGVPEVARSAQQLTTKIVAGFRLR